MSKRRDAWRSSATPEETARLVVLEQAIKRAKSDLAQASDERRTIVMRVKARFRRGK